MSLFSLFQNPVGTAPNFSYRILDNGERVSVFDDILSNIYDGNGGVLGRMCCLNVVDGEADGTLRLWSFHKPSLVQFSTYDTKQDENGVNGSGFDLDNAYVTSSITHHSHFEAQQSGLKKKIYNPVLMQNQGQRRLSLQSTQSDVKNIKAKRRGQYDVIDAAERYGVSEEESEDEIQIPQQTGISSQYQQFQQIQNQKLNQQTTKQLLSQVPTVGMFDLCEEIIGWPTKEMDQNLQQEQLKEEEKSQLIESQQKDESKKDVSQMSAIERYQLKLKQEEESQYNVTKQANQSLQDKDMKIDKQKQKEMEKQQEKEKLKQKEMKEKEKQKELEKLEMDRKAQRLAQITDKQTLFHIKMLQPIGNPMKNSKPTQSNLQYSFNQPNKQTQLNNNPNNEIDEIEGKQPGVAQIPEYEAAINVALSVMNSVSIGGTGSGSGGGGYQQSLFSSNQSNFQALNNNETNIPNNSNNKNNSSDKGIQTPKILPINNGNERWPCWIVHQMKAHQHGVNGLSVSPPVNSNGQRLLASVGGDGIVRVWDFCNGMRLCWESPNVDDDQYFVGITGGNQNNINMNNNQLDQDDDQQMNRNNATMGISQTNIGLQTKQSNSTQQGHYSLTSQMKKGHGHALFCASWISKTALLTGGYERLCVWDVNEGKLMDILSCKANQSTRACSVHPCEPFLICSGSEEGTVLLWDLRVNCDRGGPIKKFFGHKESITCCDFGTLRISASNSDMPSSLFSPSYVENSNQFMNLFGNSSTNNNFGGTQGINRSTSPNATICTNSSLMYPSPIVCGQRDKLHLLATGSKDRTVKVWDWTAGYQNPVLTTILHRDEVSAVRFFGERILSAGSRDGSVRLWSPVNQTRPLSGNQNTNSVEFTNGNQTETLNNGEMKKEQHSIYNSIPQPVLKLNAVQNISHNASPISLSYLMRKTRTRYRSYPVYRPVPVLMTGLVTGEINTWDVSEAVLRSEK
ncbi:MAG: hypothetical protein EZS28_014723 [Streblomastix strix]|uniref:Uncharacterized protein n=1 Tax=Streblomastix strix TaxID=222440 RepID=A0A5J4W4U2_9EUKA|nr:MAG: hypothetical protein EZS28_014723 [Streblomastix strix]